jgi:transglutaminase-like putative cysteine protease
MQPGPHDRRGFRPRGLRAAPAAAAIIAATLLLASCGNLIEGTLDLINDKPTAEDTLTEAVAYAKALEDAAREGLDKITLNVVASESELENITSNIDPFWGAPVSYLVSMEWDDLSLTETGPAIDVKTVEFAIEQSVSYYAYNEYLSAGAVSPPADLAADVSAVSGALPGIVAEIEASLADSEGTDYDKALAVHDWIVENIDYDAGMSEGSGENGVAGALIGRSTMCQGYAEAFGLLMRCISDADVRIEVGSGKSSLNTTWVNHAWNLVNMDGVWYQVDATFDDPVNSDRSEPSHLYFGRSDEGMASDHQWSAGYWPESTGDDLLYFNREGMYAKNKKKLRSIVKKLMKKDRPAEIEIAVANANLRESDLQFIYDINRNVDSIMYSFTESGNATIVNLKLEY